MTHDETALAAFLEGELDDAEATAWDTHLLACDPCWAALDEARLGRALAVSLREPVPASLRNRVVVAVEVAARRSTRRRRLVGSRVIAVALAAVVAVAATVLVTTRPDGRIHDPKPIATVLDLAADQSLVPPSVGKGIVITRLRVKDSDVVLARSNRPFPMPDGAIPLADDPRSPWLARRGDISLLCFSHPTPMLLAGRASPETLTEVAAALGIAPS